LEKLILLLDVQTDVSYSMCNCCGATTTANGRLLQKTHFTMEFFLILGGCKVGVENFCTKLPKGTPLRQIWSNKLFGICGSDVVLTVNGDGKKVPVRESPLENRVVYNTTSLRRDFNFYKAAIV